MCIINNGVYDFDDYFGIKGLQTQFSIHNSVGYDIYD